MPPAAGHSWRPDRGLGRWIGAAAATLLLHGGAVAAGLMTWQGTDPPLPPSAAIMMELMPAPVAPPAPQTQAAIAPALPVSESEPEPEPEVESEPQSNQVVDLPVPAPLPVAEVPVALRAPDVELLSPVVEKPKAAKVAEKPKEKAKEKAKEKPRDKPQEKAKEIARKDPEAQTQPDKPAPAVAAAAPSAPVQPAQVAAAPSAADIARRAAAEANWQGLLLAHLEKFKRYPKSAERRNLEGTPLLRMRLDRSGRVLGFALERGSGHDSLDEEVLALVARAAPMPALPREMPQTTVEIVVPVDFNLSK